MKVCLIEIRDGNSQRYVGEQKMVGVLKYLI